MLARTITSADALDNCFRYICFLEVQLHQTINHVVINFEATEEYFVYVQ